jgi:hypothetical protein
VAKGAGLDGDLLEEVLVTNPQSLLKKIGLSVK